MHTLSTALLILAASAGASAQTPAPPRAASNPSTLSVQVTDKSGNGIGNVAIALSGPVDRSGMSGPDGSLAFRSMRAGTYRLRFEHEGFVTLEREVVLARGAGDVSVALNPSPVKPVVTPPPAPAPVVPRPAERTLRHSRTARAGAGRLHRSELHRRGAAEDLAARLQRRRHCTPDPGERAVGQPAGRHRRSASVRSRGGRGRAGEGTILQGRIRLVHRDSARRSAQHPARRAQPAHRPRRRGGTVVHGHGAAGQVTSASAVLRAEESP